MGTVPLDPVDLTQLASVIPLAEFLIAFGVPAGIASTIEIIVLAILRAVDPADYAGRIEAALEDRDASEHAIDTGLHDDIGI